MNRHGLKRETVELDKTVWEWSLSVPNVTKTMVQHFAKQLFTQAGLVTFKASDGWYRRWRKRWKHNPFLSKTATKTLQTEKNPVGTNDNKISTNNKTDDSACNITTTNMDGIIHNDNESLVSNQNDDNQNQNISYNNSNTSTIDTFLNNDIIDNILNMKEKNNNDNNYVDDITSDCIDVCLTSQNINNEQLISNENSGISNCLDDENMVISPNDCNLTSSINEQQIISRNNTNFHIPRFSLSSDIFSNCNLLESGDEMFCKICGDFHVDDYRCNKILSDNIIQINNDNSLLQLNSIIAPVDNLNNDNNTCNALSTSDNTNTKISNRDLSSNNDTLLRTRRKGERYLPQFKSKVVAYTKTHSIKSTAVKFNVCEGTVSEWVKAKVKVHDDLQILQNKKRLKESKAEIGFIKWLCEIRNERRLLSQQIIKDKLDEFINKYKNDQSDKKFSKKPCWLNHYYERLKSTINEEISKNISIEKKHIVYPAAFKMEVAMYAEKSSQQAAARVFCVARKRVYEWLEIMKTKGSIKNVKVNGTSYVTDSEVDNKIWLWYSSQEVTPTSFEVREMGRKLYKEKGHVINCSSGWFYRWRERFNLSPSKSLDYLLLEWILSELDKNKSVSHLDLLDHAVSLPHRTSFKASRGWALRFCKRYPSLLQRVPTVNTSLPPSMELKVSEFRSHIQEIIINLGLSSDNIGTIDEVPIHFVHNSDKKKVLLIRRPGFDNCQASLIVSSLVSGKLLPSVLVLKGTSDSTTLSSTKNVSVFSRKDGCVDEEIMLYWLENVWFRYQTGVSLLVSDHYQPHVCSMVKETIATSLCRYELFPPGCSSKLQPLSISISNSFKEKIERSWKDSREWSSWSHTSSFPGLPSQQEILTWITQAHNEIANQQEELVVAFQKTLLETNSSISDSSA